MGQLLRLIHQKWNKLRPHKIEEGKFYTISNSSNRDELVIQIERGVYKYTVFTIRNIRIGEENVVIFDREVIMTHWDGHDFTKDNFFDKILAGIFYDILEKSIKNFEQTKEEILKDEDDGTDYFEESTPQRTVRAKGDSVSKKRVFSRQKRTSGVSRTDRVLSKVQPPSDHGSDTDIFS